MDYWCPGKFLCQLYQSGRQKSSCFICYMELNCEGGQFTKKTIYEGMAWYIQGWYLLPILCSKLCFLNPED